MFTSRAEMGVGTLIIFIAVLFVAATAASVLIQTSGSLQGRAYAVGSQATRQVTTSVMIFEASATDGRAVVENISFVVKLPPGANSLNLETLSLTLNTVNSSTYYVSSGSSLYVVNETNQNGTFGYTYVQNGPSHVDGLLLRGDLVSITIRSPRPIIAGELPTVRFLPREGLPVTVGLQIPDVYTTAVVRLYP